MKGYRFYAEMPVTRKSKSANKTFPHDPWTVARLKAKAADGFRCDLIAILLDESGRPEWDNGLYMHAFSVAIEGNPLSYNYGSVHRDYVRERATRIPESLARQLSPELFVRLES